MWTLSGRMWFLNWSWNTMMVSYAREPQINADIEYLEGRSGSAWEGRTGHPAGASG